MKKRKQPIQPALTAAKLARCRQAALAEAIKAVDAYAMDFLRTENEYLKGISFAEDGGKETPRDWDSNDVELNDDHPRTQAENHAKGTAFNIMRSADAIKALLHIPTYAVSA